MIHVAIAADQNIFHQSRVVIRSAVANCSKPIAFHFMTRGITPEAFATFRQVLPSSATFIQYQMDQVHHEGNIKLGNWITVSTMDRLRMPSVLPSSVSQLIYIDIDCVVMGDLAEMFALPTGECGLSAKLSTRKGFWMGSDYARRARVDVPKLLKVSGGDWRNFNAGVLLMNLEKMRAMNFESICAELVKQTGCNDQIALVMYSRGRHTELPCRWNTWITIDHDTPQVKPWGILHFVGSSKPWDTVNKPMRKHWDRWTSAVHSGLPTPAGDTQ